jgi:hypothetical protein
MFAAPRILQPFCSDLVLVESESLRQPLRPVVTIQCHFNAETVLGGYKVSYRTGTKQITLYRNLLAAITYEQGGVSIEEILVLFDLAGKMEEKRQKDRAFDEKYGDWLITSFDFVSGLSPQVFPYVYHGDRQEAEKTLTPFLPSRQAYFGWRRNPVRDTPARVQLRNPLAPPKALPPKRYIGVGYRDKGNRRDPAVDGTPSWQETASSQVMRAKEETPIQEAKQETILSRILKT